MNSLCKMKSHRSCKLLYTSIELWVIIEQAEMKLQNWRKYIFEELNPVGMTSPTTQFTDNLANWIRKSALKDQKYRVLNLNKLKTSLQKNSLCAHVYSRCRICFLEASDLPQFRGSRDPIPGGIWSITFYGLFQSTFLSAVLLAADLTYLPW